LKFISPLLIALAFGWAVQINCAAHSHVAQQQNPQPQKRGATHVEDLFGGNSSGDASSTRDDASPTPSSTQSDVRRATRAQQSRAGNSTATNSTTSTSATMKAARGLSRVMLPAPVRFGMERGRGLLVRAWINGAGPYTLAIDTGAGATILSQRVASEARVEIRSGRATAISGLSGASPVSGREAFVSQLALGERGNLLPARGLTIVTDHLPPDVDGVLDPTESFWPLGYTLDMESGNLSAFDPRTSPLRTGNARAGGTIVAWLMDGTSRRPFVLLDNGRRALLDTGSGFGLAVSESAARGLGVIETRGTNRDGVRDIGGGSIMSRRIAPLTVRIGSLVLRGVPTDVLSGVEAGAPILLGRDALGPFRLSFDPLNRLIEIAPPRNVRE
jgi:hypothetical protein